MNGVGDIRPIAHSLMRSPSFSLGVVLTLALFLATRSNTLTVGVMQPIFELPCQTG